MSLYDMVTLLEYSNKIWHVKIILFYSLIFFSYLADFYEVYLVSANI